MKKNKGIIMTGIFLIGLSVVLHYIHFLIFRDLHHIMIFLLADIAFIPLEVFFVTVVLDRMIEKREKAHIMEKMNMLIGLFYSELGTKSLRNFVKADSGMDKYKSGCKFTMNSEDKDFDTAYSVVKSHNHSVDISKIDLVELKAKLSESKDLLVSLIANPSLLEHESFSELLMGVFHLYEELAMREVSKDQSTMSSHDLEHLTVDINRAYKSISSEWFSYMKHIKHSYPYLFYTALQTNPYLND